MGIRGLTSFIEARSHLYMESYELHDTNLVIDGNAVACQLYKWHTKSYDCFGGDYDKFGQVIINFFNILFECNVTPYVIFDGGYEKRKVATVFSRMKNKIESAYRLDSTTQGSISVFPLFLKQIFRDLVLNLNIKCVQCDFESDTETANIARTLNCPVLSYDSDFFIFDVLYIPFSSVEISARKSKAGTYKYIPCEIYRVEKFLKSYGDLDKNKLPLLAALLGNDYVRRNVFSMFYRNLQIQKCHGAQSVGQKRIKSVLVWLQNETKESAIKTVLGRYKKKRRQIILRKLKNAMKGYKYYDSVYFRYLGITPILENTEAANDDLDAIFDEGEEENEENSVDDISEEEVSSSEEDLVDLQTSNNFLDKFRRCQYPPCFMDMTKNNYYCIPQVENTLLENAHSLSFQILLSIHKILNDSDYLLCILRCGKCSLGKKQLKNSISVPSFQQINHMNETYKINTFLEILKIDHSFLQNCLNSFPKSWYLFILAIKVLLNNSLVTLPFLYSLILSKIILSYVDKKTEFCRSMKTLDKKINKLQEDSKTIVDNNIIDSLDNISYEDSLFCLKNCLLFFQMDAKLAASNRLFDKTLVHLISQFQSCLLHIKYLNYVLDGLFEDILINETLNCTFVYNVFSNLKKRTNIDNYVNILLNHSPSIQNAFQLIVNTLKESFDNNVIPNTAPIKKKKRKKKKESVDDVIREEYSDDEFLLDPNNKFALLSNLQL